MTNDPVILPEPTRGEIEDVINEFWFKPSSVTDIFAMTETTISAKTDVFEMAKTIAILRARCANSDERIDKANRNAKARGIERDAAWRRYDDLRKGIHTELETIGRLIDLIVNNWSNHSERKAKLDLVNNLITNVIQRWGLDMKENHPTEPDQIHITF